MKKILSMVLTLSMILTITCAGFSTAYGATESEVNEKYQKCADYIYNTVTEASVGTLGGEWVIYGLGKAGYPMSDEYLAKYKANVEEYTKEHKGVLHKRKYTEYSRIIVAYSTIGLDATNVAGYNLVEHLGDTYKDKDGKEKFWVSWQGINGTIWALRALDAGNYKEPIAKPGQEQVTRQKLVKDILSQHLASGGWALWGEISDPDITAMTIECLAPYTVAKKAGSKELAAKVKKAVKAGLKALSGMQKEDGGYDSWGTMNSESCAQTICAASSMGINPNTDPMFIKNGKSVIDGILNFYDSPTGGFRHINQSVPGFEPIVNQMATEQAYYALAAYKTTFPEIIKDVNVTKSASKITVDFKEDKIGTGYQIKVAKDANFKKGLKTLTVSQNRGEVKKLKKGTTYYVKVRGFKKINGNKAFGEYSETVKVVL